MFKNYLKLAYRNLIKNKENSFIHIFGLTIGLTGCLLIGLFVLDELKYDTFHPNGDRTYRVYTDRGGEGGGAIWASTSPAFSPTLKADFPEVEQTLRIFRIRSKQLFKKDDKNFLEEKGVFAESSIFELFHLPFLHGDPSTALQEVNSIVLTKTIAEKYFGDKNPIGENILVNNKERKITGVLKPLPAISCIGAFGLAAYAAEQRRKEIGIRKVLGATTNGIVLLLSKDFMKLVFLALLIASPIAWYFMNSWLEGFAYRVNIQWWVFVVAGLVAMLVAFLTVGFNGLKAAITNPIKSLRTE